MSSKRNISGVVIAVVAGCAIFLGYQYFMVNANRQALNKEDALGVESGMSEVASSKLGEEATGDRDESLIQVPEVRAFVEFVQNDTISKTIDDTYVNEAIVHLLNALETVSEKGIAPINSIDIDNLRSQLAEYETTQSLEKKSEQLKSLITTAAGMLQGMQNYNVALEEELKQLRDNADAINGAAPAQEQSEDLEKFFEQAAVVLEEAERNI